MMPAAPGRARMVQVMRLMLERSRKFGRKRQGSISIAALALVVAAGCDAHAREPYVAIRGKRVTMEVVTTPEAQRRGLGGRDGLAADRGMAFPYERAGKHTFWMKDMRFDIDIVWIREDRIVDIRHRVPHPTDPSPSRLPTYTPREIANLVIEVPAGYAALHGWRIGDRVEVRLQ